VVDRRSDIEDSDEEEYDRTGSDGGGDLGTSDGDFTETVRGGGGGFEAPVGDLGPVPGSLPSAPRGGNSEALVGPPPLVVVAGIGKVRSAMNGISPIYNTIQYNVYAIHCQ